jgi:hypothetical protein
MGYGIDELRCGLAKWSAYLYGASWLMFDSRPGFLWELFTELKEMRINEGSG